MAQVLANYSFNLKSVYSGLKTLADPPDFYSSPNLIDIIYYDTIREKFYDLQLGGSVTKFDTNTTPFDVEGLLNLIDLLKFNEAGNSWVRQWTISQLSISSVDLKPFYKGLYDLMALKDDDAIIRQFNQIIFAGDDNFELSDFSDVVSSCGGDDTISGKKGADKIICGSGEDVADGGPGRDSITGGGGRDGLTGSGGLDRFIYKRISDSRASESLEDVIEDFNESLGELIDLSAIDANSEISGNQAFNFIGDAQFSGPGQVRFAVLGDGSGGILQVNIDAGSAADMQIFLKGVAAFSVDNLAL